MTVRLANLALIAVTAAPLGAQATPLTVDRIFRSAELAPQGGPDVRWLKDGRSWVEARRARGGGVDIVRVDAVTGQTTVLVEARALVDADRRPIAIEEIELSPDERKALLFHNSVRVWRSNTRGVYHVVDFDTKMVRPIAVGSTLGGARPTHAADSMAGEALGKEHGGVSGGVPSFVGRGLASGAADPDLQMFAKFSPDSRSVAYVRGNNLWVTDLATGQARQLTTDGSDDVINGTTDWVYEEELGLRDAFRWSPDSKRLAYWRFDQTAVPAYPIVNETEALYPVVSVLRYPKAGTPNSRVTLGVVNADGGPTKWLAVGPDTGQYLARMEWVDVDSVAVQRLVRKQDRLDLMVVSATSGAGRTALTERDSAYVDVEGEAVTWLADGKRFLLRTDRTGWRQYVLYDRSGRAVRQITPDGADYLELAAVDEAAGVAYVLAAAPTPMERQLFRCPLERGSCRRVTTVPGTHAFTVSPNAKYAVDVRSRLSEPPVVELVELPSLRVVRTLEDNAPVAARLAASGVRRPAFLKVPMPDGTQLDAYRIVPPAFDSTRQYPVLMYVYGGPAAPQVNDAWSGTRFLWHEMLAEKGYVVMVVDNRGAAWRGREFRKLTQYQLGVRESQDQIDAAKWIGRQPWADASRIGLWGWSYGGYMTALTLSRGGSVFKAGMSVAPVVDMRYYDTIYTERFMWTPQENADGYRRSSVLTYLGGMTARFLLAYGTGDDNVHPQNSIVLANALVAANKPFSMLLYPNRTHSISGGNAQPHLFESLTRFVLENL
ncbi:peptidase S9B dipeptidylpeptidase IV domain protein [Gemmatirosa kalamazoonensis]|uniref:Peptidase S9B dipeptidylpeptidase IV domain protein n=1 Tax=Gemmatirosa kalamazoonensis TaxID=861299 RepID=W0RLW3_9BACT|nr:S9 family peptidase [Gemmatirosa kalamazoonensis]AHG92074.1 peptidase S9B dipeptidylpeptidase IV domain protein [Gemmatirosa kalamazoonensis]